MPVYNGLTDEWHPTQMLADFLTMREHLHKPDGEVDVLLPRRRPLQHGRLVPGGGVKLGMDVRIAAPRSLWPSQELIDMAQGFAEQSGGHVTISEDVAEAVRGADFLLTDVWVSMGEADSVWAERIELLKPYQINADTMRRRATRTSSSCTACRRSTTPTRRWARRSSEKFGMSALEVTEDVFESPASIVFDEAENRMHTIKAVMVATLGELTVRVVVALGGNALLRRGQPLSAENQRENARAACRALAPLALEHELVISHGNGPQVGLLALQGSAYTAVDMYPLDVLGRADGGHDRLHARAGARQRAAVRAAARHAADDDRGRRRRPRLR